MLNAEWREQTWSGLNELWDVIIVGGGITGAGILNLAARCGLKTLLLEAADFSFGTSSRSSKLVHGGFRYLRNRQFKVTCEAVREREWMLSEAADLVSPLGFLLPNYFSYHFPGWELSCGVTLYDLLAPKWEHRNLNIQQMIGRCSFINRDTLLGGFEYYDARVDDSRLVMRILQDGMLAGGKALNYARVVQLLRNHTGQVCGVVVEDASKPGRHTQEVKARVVINATGPWSDDLRAQIKAAPRLRKQRGSHLVFSRMRLPMNEAITLFHPKDHRAMFVIPWEGVTLVGTTDLDHMQQEGRPDQEPFASQNEIAYILEAARFLFPGLNLCESDIISTFSGLRPIVRSGDDSPSKTSRAHSIWKEDGLITITGGKLTTFRIMAREALTAAKEYLPISISRRNFPRIFDPIFHEPARADLSPASWHYLAGRYGVQAASLINSACSEGLQMISPSLPNLWAELRWAAKNEGVVHLDDLILRRVRLGLLLPDGARNQIPQIRRVTQAELGWSDQQWQAEVERYCKIWESSYSPSPRQAQ